jgi:hypothetical protein
MDPASDSRFITTKRKSTFKKPAWSCQHAQMTFKLGCLFLTLGTCSWLASCSAEATEQADTWQPFSRIRQDFSAIRPETLPNSLLRQKLARTVAAYEKLRSVIKTKQDWSSASFAPGYAFELHQDEQLFATFAQASILPEPGDTEKLSAALDDLYLKVEACQLNHGKAVGSVAVTVHTKKSGREVANWRVMYIAKILRLYPHASWTDFPQLSSPTKWELAPGNYLMRTENPETGETSSVQEIPIDRDEECDLTIP